MSFSLKLLVMDQLLFITIISPQVCESVHDFCCLYVYGMSLRPWIAWTSICALH